MKLRSELKDGIKAIGTMTLVTLIVMAVRIMIWMP